MVRANVFTGWSIGRSGPRAYSHRVNLCVDCVAARRHGRRKSLYLVAAAVASLLAVLFIVAVVQVVLR